MDAADFAQKNNEVYLDAALKTQLRKSEASRVKCEAKPGESEDGICIDCEGPISRARLAANPQAIRCVDCQTKFGRNGNR